MSLLKKLVATSPAHSAWGLLIIRLWFGLVLALSHGAPKIAGLEKLTASVTKLGFPAPSAFAFLAATGELVGGILLAVGLLTRLAGIWVAATMLVAAFVVHSADPFMKKEFALAYAVAAIALTISGAGPLSLDAKLANRG